jgi:hypothetical protein
MDVDSDCTISSSDSDDDNLENIRQVHLKEKIEVLEDAVIFLKIKFENIEISVLLIII